MVVVLLFACLFWRKSVLCLPPKHVWNDLIDTDKTLFDESNGQNLSILVYEGTDLLLLLLLFFRSSHWSCSSKQVALKNFAKLTGKRLCQSLFLNKLQPATLLKKRLWHRYFPVNFKKFLRTPFFTEQLQAPASDSSATSYLMKVI